jgi:hypothetical protein
MILLPKGKWVNEAKQDTAIVNLKELATTGKLNTSAVNDLVKALQTLH